MRLIFTNENNKPTATKYALLIKDQIAHLDRLNEHYIDELSKDIDTDNLIIIGLDYDNPKKPTAQFVKDSCKKLDKVLKQFGVDKLLIADSHYFKVITKSTKVTPHYGYELESKLDTFPDYKCILAPNYQQLFYDPKIQNTLDLCLKTFVDSINGFVFDMGSNIIHKAYYPESISDLRKHLFDLHQYDMLTCDIETYGLSLADNLTSVGFAWNKHEGIAFDFYLEEMKGCTVITSARDLLINFFKNYKGTLIFHSGTFDIKMFIKDLFMENYLDNKGLINGLETFYPKVHDTKIIAYLATNSTAGNNLSLKELAHEYTGNYAVDVTDVSKIPMEELLRYNLTDCLATWYVFDKYYPKMIQDNQLDIYNNIFIPSMKVITHMELTGMPLDINMVHDVEYQLERDIEHVVNIIQNNRNVHNFNKLLRLQEMLSANSKLKKKKHPLEKFDDLKYNPSSTIQTAQLLYQFMNLPVIDTTEKGAPAVGSKTIKKLLTETSDPEILEILNSLIKLADATIIKNTFIKAFINKSILKDDATYYLHGNFNLGGTVSGRLSSSGPNLQNIPSTRDTPYTKMVKSCFKAPDGWLFVGADFSSLEDRISALTTKDSNKLKVYTDGYDGHCLRAYGYFGNKMPDINPNSVSSINSIKKKYPHFRQDSKIPTFALTYGGTFHAIMDQAGIPEDEAKNIEKKYHELYSESDEWVQNKLQFAEKHGYIEVAFGLRVRTPILYQTIAGKKSTPYEAAAESRTAGNALGQSYGMLNNRAAIEFMNRVYNSPYKYDIKPIAHIHDAQYFIIKNSYGCLKWFNDNLVECMEWQDLDEIKHPDVHLGGEVDLFYPTWLNGITIPNKASKREIRELIKKNL